MLEEWKRDAAVVAALLAVAAALYLNQADASCLAHLHDKVPDSTSNDYRNYRCDWWNSLGFLSLVTSVVLTASTIGLWVVTRQSADAAKTQARAAQLAAEAAIGVELPRLIQSRIYLEDAGFSALASLSTGIAPTAPTQDDLLRRGMFVVEMKNLGRTAAELFEISFNTSVTAKLPVQPTYKEPKPISPTETIEANGGMWKNYIFLWDKVTLPPAPTDNALGALFRPKLWVYGYVRYLDFLGEVTEERFCAQLFGTTESELLRGGPSTYFGRRRLPQNKAGE